MVLFQHTKVLPQKPRELFNLVLDIEAYPKFIPWCAAARIITHTDTEIIAELVVQVKGFSEKYKSRVTWVTSENKEFIIDISAISGPFEYLKNTWYFFVHEEGTLIKFNIDFQMKSAIARKLIANYFLKASEKIMNAFEQRAFALGD